MHRNSCRSKIAHGYLQLFADGKAPIYSAGVAIHKANPKALQVITADHIDTYIQQRKCIHRHSAAACTIFWHYAFAELLPANTLGKLPYSTAIAFTATCNILNWPLQCRCIRH